MKKAYEFNVLLAIGWCLMFTQVAVGQENYLPGYVIASSGDTLQGLIDYRNWEYNPGQIRFQSDTQGRETVVYRPFEIREFGVDGEQYVAAIVSVDASTSGTKDLPTTAVPVLATDTTFLQTVIQGSKSLYHYKRRKGEEHFYIRQADGFELLIYKRYLKTGGAKQGIAENRRYLGQLAVYLRECSSIQAQLEGIRYNRKSLNELFASYYVCTQSNATFQRTAEKISINVGVLAGLSISSMSFRSSASVNTYLEVDYPLSVNVAGGFFFNAVLPRNQGKWSFCNELFFTSYQFSGRSDNYTDEDRYTINYTEIGYAYVKLNSLARFSYPMGQWGVYANVGMSNGLAIREENYRRKESIVFSMKRSEEFKAIEETRRYEQGLVLGLGTRFGRYSLEARHERGNGMSEYTTLGSPTRRYYLLAGFIF